MHIDLLRETVRCSIGREAKLDDSSVLHNVHLIGLIGKANRFGDSKVPYTYAEEAIRKAVEGKQYDNVNVFLGHGVGNEPRNPKDRVGIIIPSTVKHKEGVGAVGNIQLDPKHPYFESVRWWAQNYPDKLMMSHEAALRYRKDLNSVVEIKDVASVDFVIDGNTTTELFKEGVIADRIASVDDENKLYRIVDTASTLVWSEMYPVRSDPQKASRNDTIKKILPIYKDLIKELSQLTNSQEGVTKDDMDITKLTLAELSAARPDLVSAIASEAVARESTITNKVDEVLSAIPHANRAAVFVNLVREAVRKGDDATARSLVEDRKALLSAPTSVLVSESTQKTKEPQPQAESKFSLPSEDLIKQALAK